MCSPPRCRGHIGMSRVTPILAQIPFDLPSFPVWTESFLLLCLMSLSLYTDLVFCQGQISLGVFCQGACQSWLEVYTCCITWFCGIHVPVIPAWNHSKFERLDFPLQKTKRPVVFISVFSQTVILSPADFSWYKPQVSWWYSPGSPWDPFNSGITFATCCSSGTKALLSKKLHSTTGSCDSLLPSIRNTSALGLMLLFIWLVQSIMCLNAMIFCRTC